ncbi:MAG: hypothetical protein RLO21_16450, partial [Nitratireductor sp.]
AALILQKDSVRWDHPSSHKFGLPDAWSGTAFQETVSHSGTPDFHSPMQLKPAEQHAPSAGCAQRAAFIDTIPLVSERRPHPRATVWQNHPVADASAGSASVLQAGPQAVLNLSFNYVIE